MTIAVLGRLGAHDRALMLRCALAPSAPWRERATWKAVTHLGGTGPSLLSAGLPWFACCAAHRASILALVTLTVSHLLVQLVKRTVARSRPGSPVRGYRRGDTPSDLPQAPLARTVTYLLVGFVVMIAGLGAMLNK